MELQRFFGQGYSLAPEDRELMAESGQDGFQFGDQVGRWSDSGHNFINISCRCCNGWEFYWQFGHGWSLVKEFRNPCGESDARKLGKGGAHLLTFLSLKVVEALFTVQVSA
ncbi:hypothetical protein SAMN05216178_3989 [Pseudomonas saponiphila]|uniref:Uncharacterized protein n=1 Tax=Pseudomonas saponiphila TaxID=556534 RepID=A0A1H4R0F3_9PSED|nr:hypothetical protein SAMN05216178_3989 [Pseudomonas saponiphila]